MATIEYSAAKRRIKNSKKSKTASQRLFDAIDSVENKYLTRERTESCAGSYR